MRHARDLQKSDVVFAQLERLNIAVSAQHDSDQETQQACATLDTRHKVRVIQASKRRMMMHCCFS